jgi:hypothetical protein
VILCDANVILNSIFKDQPGHPIAFSFVHSLRSGTADYLWHPLIATGVVRICGNLHRKGAGISTTQALEILNLFHFNQNARLAYDSEAQWQTFRRLVVDLRLSGNDVTDANIALIALQHKAALATFDRGFARFPGLHWIDLNEGENLRKNPG